MYLSQLWLELGSKMGDVPNCGLECRETRAFTAGSGRVRALAGHRGFLSLLSDLRGRFARGRIAVFLCF